MERISGVDPGLALLLQRTSNEELDYGFVMDCLRLYKNPRVKLCNLLKIGALVRVKKGVYIFGPTCARKLYSPEVLANMIYGPSYVSLEWACQYYRLIPENVTAVTSVTTQRSRSFQTPAGPFSYHHQPIEVYPVGVGLMHVSDRQTALIAAKEKALVDLLVVRRGGFSSKKQLRTTLFDDLRIEEEDLAGLDRALLQEINKARPHSAVQYLMEVLQ